MALRGVSLHVEEGEFVAVIGPNGAGKTTLFKAISGRGAAGGRRITCDGQPIGDLPAAARPHRGIAHVPEGRQVFGDLTVEENLQLGTTALRDRRHVRAASSAATRCSRSWPSAATSRPGRCRAGSSRCWRSPAAWPASRAC